MDIVISYKGVSRRLSTPFAVCASGEDMDRLIRALEVARASLLDSPYGWVRVDTHHPSDARGEPKEWDE